MQGKDEQEEVRHQSSSQICAQNIKTIYCVTETFSNGTCFINIKDKITVTPLLHYVTCLTSPAKSDCFAALSLLSYGGVFVH